MWIHLFPQQSQSSPTTTATTAAAAAETTTTTKNSTSLSQTKISPYHTLLLNCEIGHGSSWNPKATTPPLLEIVEASIFGPGSGTTSASPSIPLPPPPPASSSTGRRRALMGGGTKRTCGKRGCRGTCSKSENEKAFLKKFGEASFQERNKLNVEVICFCKCRVKLLSETSNTLAVPCGLKVSPYFFAIVCTSQIVFFPCFLPSIYLGMCPFKPSPCSKHASSFADFELWDRAMTRDEMLGWTKCQETSLQHGNVVDWRSAEWDLVEMKEEKSDESDFCREQRPGEKQKNIFWRDGRFFTMFPPYLPPRLLFWVPQRCQKNHKNR